MCHSTKRTHFLFADFLMYRISIQKLIFFAEAFANGFVLEKRTHFEGFHCSKNSIPTGDEPKVAAHGGGYQWHYAQPIF